MNVCFTCIYVCPCRMVRWEEKKKDEYMPHIMVGTNFKSYPGNLRPKFLKMSIYISKVYTKL